MLIFFRIVGSVNDSYASQPTRLTLDSAVDIAIHNSYRTKQLELDIKRNLHWLRARQASLKTQMYLNLQSPDLQHVSANKWNSVLGRDEIVRQNTLRWQSDMSIKQPLILLGYPTNGYLSLNHTIYRYLQRDNGDKQVDYYNRFYLKFEQPLLLPNELKNNLEEAELNLEDIKLAYIGERVEIIEDISDDYYNIFRLTYNQQIYYDHLQYLDRLKNIADSLIRREKSREMERDQIQLEMSNVQERFSSNQSELRRSVLYLKQRLRLNSQDSLYVKPEINLLPVQVNLDEAIQYGYSNSSWLQQLHIRKRRSELDVENEKAQNAFHLSVEMTYGLETGEPRFHEIWEDFDNSNSITLNAYVPLWDGGERRERIAAEMLDLERRDLEIEEEKKDIKNDITTAFTNLNEYYNRCEKMMKSRELAREITQASIQKYKNNHISLQDMLQIIEKTTETEQNFMEVYLGYKKALLDLMAETYYDFEKNLSLYDEVEMKLE